MFRFPWRGLIPCWACLILLGITVFGSGQTISADEPLTAPVPTADENPQPETPAEPAPAEPSTAPAPEQPATEPPSQPDPEQPAPAANPQTTSTPATSNEQATAEERHSGAKTEDHHEEGHHEEGVPMDFKRDLALWSLITFLVFLFVLKKLAWKPLITGLDKRESNLRQELAQAQADRQKAMKLLADYQGQLSKVQDEVREILAEARRDAEVAKQNIIKEAETEAKATRDRAILEIDRHRDAALKEIFLAVTDRVTEATEHVLGRALNDDDQNRLVTEALEQVSRKQSS